MQQKTIIVQNTALKIEEGQADTENHHLKIVEAQEQKSSQEWVLGSFYPVEHVWLTTRITRHTQPQKEKRRKNDYMETKEHATEKTNGSMMKSKRKLKNTSRQTIMKTQPYKIYGMQQKQF